MRFLFLILLFSFLSFSAFSRQPAVLPGYGLSIEKENKILPKTAKFPGYSFTNTPSKSSSPVQDNLNKLSKAGPQSISIYLTIFALLFPFGLWFINAKSLKDENELINKNLKNDQLEDNVIHLGEAKDSLNRSEDSEEDTDDQRKAS